METEKFWIVYKILIENRVQSVKKPFKVCEEEF